MLRVLRFIAGAAVAIAIWWYAMPVYSAALAGAVRFVHPFVTAAGRTIEISRAGAPGIRIAIEQLTYNIVLFAGLLAARPPRRLWKGVAALAVVVLFHFIAVLLSIESTYATCCGDWSKTHYTPLMRDVWRSAEYVYRMGGMFAIAFAAWYAATSSAREQQPAASQKSRTTERPRRRAAHSRR